jgi:hypothetical protein
MAGDPPPPDRLVNTANWQEPPFNRWGFLHVRELIPTARISRGEGPPTPLPAGERSIDPLVFRFEGEELTVAQMLDATYTDALLVLHEGRVVSERYMNGMSPMTTHLLMSVSKSLTATLAGVLVDRGELDPAATVPDYIVELRGSAFEGCTIQHLLDMRAGTRWSEEYTDPGSDARIYEQVMGWRPRTAAGLPPDLYTYMAGLGNARAHGGPFEYRSILTDLLGWVLERAGGERFPGLFSRHVWSRIGAEQDADVTVDTAGCALADGGICTTLRDLARFGQMHLQGGELAGQRVVPETWVERVRRPDPELIEAFEAAPEAAIYPGAMYHDKWWVLDPEQRIYTGFGIHGQQLLIHVPARTVVAKFSTQPEAYDMSLEHMQVLGTLAICDALADGRI